MEKWDRMGIKNVIEVAKQVHKEEIVFVKIGKFYQVYGKDAYIVSYLFEYKLKKVEEVHMCGFPESSINKVIAKLEDNKIKQYKLANLCKLWYNKGYEGLKSPLPRIRRG